jgi:hypothetical protein
MSKRNLLAVTVLTAGLGLAGATAASAHSVGNPTPTPSVTTPVPTPTQFGDGGRDGGRVNCLTPTPRDVGSPGLDNGQINQWNNNWNRHDRNRRCQQQEFDIQFSSLTPADAHGDGAVLGTGLIDIRGGFDVTSANPTIDVLETDATGVNSVTIHHEPLVVNFIDRATCSIDLAQFDAPWFINHGTGRFAGATASGLYNLTGQFSYPTVRNRCTLPFNLTPLRAAFILNYLNGRGLPTPLAVGIDVQAVGRSFVPSQRPAPEPSKTYWAPSTSAS